MMIPQTRELAIGHGLFFLVSGLWPVVDMGSFQKVTGPKTDDWLVKTVGLLIAATGGTLLLSAARNRRPSPGLSALAALQSAVLGGVSLHYASRGRISKIYLADTWVEGLWIFAWASAWARRSRSTRALLRTLHSKEQPITWH